MGHCKDCKWWKQNAHITGGDCNQPDVRLGYDYRDEPAPNWLRPNSVMVENDEGWAWHTGPEFGCVNFEAKS